MNKEEMDLAAKEWVFKFARSLPGMFDHSEGVKCYLAGAAFEESDLCRQASAGGVQRVAAIGSVGGQQSLQCFTRQVVGYPREDVARRFQVQDVTERLRAARDGIHCGPASWLAPPLS